MVLQSKNQIPLVEIEAMPTVLKLTSAAAPIVVATVAVAFAVTAVAATTTVT
jgi:hypothetical protein